MGPVCTISPALCVAHRRTGGLPGRAFFGVYRVVGTSGSRGVCRWALLSACARRRAIMLARSAQPTTNQAAQFLTQNGGVLKLALADPLPAPRQVQVLPQLVQRNIGLQQRGLARGAGAVAGGDQLVMQAQGQGHQVAAHALAVFTWEFCAQWHQPLQQRPRPGVYHHAR